MEVLREEDAEWSLMFGNSDKLERPAGRLLRVSETTEKTDLLLWQQQALCSAAQESSLDEVKILRTR